MPVTLGLLADETSIDRVAREAFGYSALRPGQREAIEAALSGHDVLVVMSTGAGKSAIYQIAALLTPGATVVVSPLIALQRDQVEALRSKAAGGAAQINSTVGARAREEAFAELSEHALEFVFLAPEQLARQDVLDELSVSDISLFVVDEAHSISEWGHDFRPDYLRLGAAIDALGRPAVLALTATAAPPVRKEIVERLGLRDPVILIRGFDRPNLRFSVERFHGEHSEARKLRALEDRIATSAPPGIVYVATRRQAEELAAALCAREAEAHEAPAGEADGRTAAPAGEGAPRGGRTAAPAGDGAPRGARAPHTHGGRPLRAASYHAGMRSKERDDVQARFMSGELDVVVATTAFGMGIDKADVRWVFHAEVAESLDAYYQEAGRAGRDGEHAEIVLFYRAEDLGLRRFFAGGGHVELDELAQVLDAVRSAPGPVDPASLHLGLSVTKLTTALARLEEAGAVNVLPAGTVRAAPHSPPTAEAVRTAAEHEERRRSFDRSRVDMMRAYAETDDCRRGFILSYFGEPFTPPCGRCDNCEAGLVHAPPSDVPFPVGARVAHAQWGEGVVQRYDDDAMVILFDEAGYKTLALTVVRERSLLTAV